MRHTPDGGFSETGLARFEDDCSPAARESQSSGRFWPPEDERWRWRLPLALCCLPLGLGVTLPPLPSPPRARAGEGVAERVLSEPTCPALEAGEMSAEDPGGLLRGAGGADAAQPPATRAARSLTAEANAQRRPRSPGVRALQMLSSRAERRCSGSSQVMPMGMGAQSDSSSVSSAGGPAVGAH